MTNTDKPFHIKLSDKHRTKLEAYRASVGLRSEADAVRDLIDHAFVPARANPQLAIGADLDAIAKRRGLKRLPVEPDAVLRERVASAVPTYERKAFNPQPKTGKTK